MPPGDQARICADLAGSADAGGIAYRGRKAESGQLSDAWDCHQPAAGRRGLVMRLMSASIAGTVITAVRAANQPAHRGRYEYRKLIGGPLKGP